MAGKCQVKNGGNQMSELYEKQEDGTLKPVKFPEHLAKRLKIYLWLRKHGLGLDEIKFLIAESFE
jgi:hypothetical protein